MQSLPTLLLIAWLLPLASFTIICIGYFFPQVLCVRVLYGIQKYAGYIALPAIVGACLLGMTAMFRIWLPTHPIPPAVEHLAEPDALAGGTHVTATEAAHEAQHPERNAPKVSVSGDWYSLGEFGKLKLTIGYYIDLLTVTMFCMVTLIASCIHIYAMGYMHDELHDVTDHEITLPDGQHFHRRGRFHRFFQYFSLFSFSMLGICIAGNLAMVFVFWELVGICSYFLIGFYFERHSASTAANKAFIVNRVGDFGMLIGLMALWSSLGTLSFGDVKDIDGNVEQLGVFNQLHEARNAYKLAPADGMIAFEARDEIAKIVRGGGD